MSTNYYLRTNACPCCKRYDNLHIGKKSIGWEFHFEGYTKHWHDPKILSYRDWKKLFNEGEIFDEYDRKVSIKELNTIIEESKVSREENIDTYTNDDFYRFDADDYIFIDADFS